MQELDDWTSIAIRRSRLNGLRLKAAKDNRTAGNLLEVILMKNNVPEVSDKEYDQKMKEVAA